MELLRNQNYKLELEILEKKLQLQKIMQTSPEVVRPIASTPLQGGFVDVVDNNQEFPQDIPTLDALRMRRNPTTKHPMLPHHFVMSNKGMLEYQSLSISEFVCGYLEMVNTLYNVCAVPWGCSVPWGDIMSTVGGYHEYRGGYLEYRWGVFSTVGDIMINVGGYLEYRGGYHEYRGGYREYRGEIS